MSSDPTPTIDLAKHPIIRIARYGLPFMALLLCLMAPALIVVAAAYLDLPGEPPLRVVISLAFGAGCCLFGALGTFISWAGIMLRLQREQR